MISELYQLLGSASTVPKPAFIWEWKRDLELNFSTEQITNMPRLAHTSFINLKTQEANFKLLTRCHLVTAALSHIYPSVTDRCWRSCGQRGTLLNIWWECPVIRPFWLDIQTHIKEALGG